MLQEVTLYPSGAGQWFSPTIFKLLNPENHLETQNRIKAQVGEYIHIDLM